MTRLGKLLLVFNLGFALMLAAWSFNIYANGIDWTDKKDDKSTPPKMGRFALRAAKLSELWKGVAPAQADWSIKRKQRADEESRLAVERAWYDKEIRYVLAGSAKGKGISEVQFAPKGAANAGQIVLDDKGLPSLAPNPLLLLSLDEYNGEDGKILTSIGEEMAEHAKQIDDANKLTDKIIGDKAKGLRGLQERINDEKTKDEGVLDELKLVQPQLINTMVEGQLIKKRHAQMQKRIEELKRLKVASK